MQTLNILLANISTFTVGTVIIGLITHYLSHRYQLTEEAIR